MSQKQEEAVECFAFVPVQKYRAMEQKIKKAEMAQTSPLASLPPAPPPASASEELKEEPVPREDPLKLDLKKSIVRLR